jgi:predicted alpha-1,2-mannosidase
MRCLLLLLALCASAAAAQQLTQFVDPFIGTAGGGNTFPGAVRPWGMASVSPHNAPGAPSGYLWGNKEIEGFGHTHLSGTGCADFGSVMLSVTEDVARPERAVMMRAKHERASPAYYRAELERPALVLEATATVRCGAIRLNRQRAGKLVVRIDAGRSLGRVGGGAIRIVSGREVEGENLGGGICGETNRHTTYFVARFSRSADETGLWIADRAAPGRSGAVEDSSLGAWFRFSGEAARKLQVKVGISYVSVENARVNLDRELPGWDFDAVRAEGERAWEEQLSRIRVAGGSRADLTKFYTALYHAMIHPGVLSDLNGEYPLAGGKGVGKDSLGIRYTGFSLWDTYRTLHPLLTLIAPEVQSAMLRTMTAFARETGSLPKWEIAGNETYLMVGDPAAAVVADSYVKGIRGFDAATAFEAMQRAASVGQDGQPMPVRPGYHDYLALGYIPFEQDTTQQWWVWGPVSTALEYCVADWATAQMARAMGKSDAAEEFERRSGFWKNLFEPEGRIMRPRMRDGSWLTPFDPLAVEGSGSWRGSGGPGYVEGNSWHYRWFAPHDVPGMIAAYGGAEVFVSELERSFDAGHFTVNNEPDIANPYLFAYVPGEEWRVRARVGEIMARDFTSGPKGLPGNDDAGTISAWFVFSALGFYPVAPGAPEYALGAPLFREARLRLNGRYYPGRQLVITSSPRGTKGGATVSLNGAPIKGGLIRHAYLVAGGRMEFR